MKQLKERAFVNEVLRFKAKIQDLTFYIILMVLSFQTKQKQFFNALSMGQETPNSPIVLPPKIFLKKLTRIKSEVIARDLDLLLAVSKEILPTFYHTSTSEARIIARQMIISFTIPLVTAKDNALYKVTSLPNQIEESIFSFIIPTHEFITLDAFKEKFLSIDMDSGIQDK